MLIAIIPARNEEGRISKILNTLHQIDEIEEILVVLNGSIDGTLKDILRFSDHKIKVLYFREPLGIDVPRAVGAACGKNRGGSGFLFIDGDLVGDIGTSLRNLLKNAAKLDLDMALTDCYPTLPTKNQLAREMLAFRQLLNQEMGIYDDIYVASPSHGPHFLSRRLLDYVPVEELAIPPVAMAVALKKSLAIGIAAKIPHSSLGSSIKNMYHSRMVSETVIGDTIEALEVFQNKKRTRIFKGKTYLGYHRERRFDLLQEFLKSPDQYLHPGN